MITAGIDESERLFFRGREDDGMADDPTVEIDVGFGVNGYIAELSGQRHRAGIAGKSVARGKSRNAENPKSEARTEAAGRHQTIRNKFEIRKRKQSKPHSVAETPF
jgi:hypothetical protein